MVIRTSSSNFIKTGSTAGTASCLHEISSSNWVSALSNCSIPFSAFSFFIERRALPTSDFTAFTPAISPKSVALSDFINSKLLLVPYRQFYCEAQFWLDTLKFRARLNNSHSINAVIAIHATLYLRRAVVSLTLLDKLLQLHPSLPVFRRELFASQIVNLFINRLMLFSVICRLPHGFQAL